MDWTEEAISTLRVLWAEGLSTAEIGRRMGISKNAVVGKAHRLNLPARPSPIRRVPGQAPAPRAPRMTPRPAMPRPMPMLPVQRPLGQQGFGGGQPAASQPQAFHAPRPAQPAPAPRPAPLRFGNSSCCWPIGEPGTAGFRFCTAAAIAGKPYCEEHAALAYVRAKPDRREDAA
ncbi:MAG: GcrA cell cycle regulator [Acetobacteraceae bacterium]|jgi:GcrA cell cycle regulator|nr:GcrA cell cycle regulator [Acetobacteraceae bacterium]